MNAAGEGIETGGHAMKEGKRFPLVKATPLSRGQPDDGSHACRSASRIRRPDSRSIQRRNEYEKC
jgi:hypothetical protein